MGLLIGNLSYKDIRFAYPMLLNVIPEMKDVLKFVPIKFCFRGLAIQLKSNVVLITERPNIENQWFAEYTLLKLG